jgi:ABC-type phosphate/phosphonate transport system permease subunit
LQCLNLKNINMSDKKKASKTTKQKKQASITKILFTTYAFILFVLGVLVVFFTKEFDILNLSGDTGEIAYIFLKFIGSFELLASFLIFSLRKLKGRVIYYSLAGLILAGFINLYLLFSLNEYIILPSIYFIFQTIVQLSFFIVLFDQAKRK